MIQIKWEHKNPVVAI